MSHIYWRKAWGYMDQLDLEGSRLFWSRAPVMEINQIPAEFLDAVRQNVKFVLCYVKRQLLVDPYNQPDLTDEYLGLLVIESQLRDLKTRYQKGIEIEQI